KLDYNNGMTTTTVYTKTDTVTGNGMYGSGNYAVPSNGTTVTGTYTWHATYNPDGNNNKAIDQGGADEQVTLTPASPQIVTLANPHGALTLNNAPPTFNDSATLSKGYFETGSITFVLTYDPDGPDGPTTVYTDHVTVSGNGTYDTTKGGDNNGGYTLPTNGP